MASSARLKKSFKPARSFEPISTGRTISITSDGTWLATTLNDEALVTELKTGRRVKLLKGDTSAVTTLALTPTPASPEEGGFLLTAQRSLALHIYSLPSLSLRHAIAKAHEAPIITCAADPTGTLFATGSADGCVKVWDAARGHCTHVFRGHGGIISALVFDIAQEEGRTRLVSGSEDARIRVWDLRTRECVHILEGHVSVVRGLSVSADGATLVSGGRDSVVNIWDLASGEVRRTVPVMETVEAVGLLHLPAKKSKKDKDGKGKKKERHERQWFYTAGDKGVVRLWDLETGLAVSPPAEASTSDKVHEILDVVYNAALHRLTSLHVDQNIVSRAIPSLAVSQQIIGFNDEVIDLAFLSSSSTSNDAQILAAATNSDLIRIYDLEKTFDCALLEGHKDVVLCLASTGTCNELVSGSKDATARVWSRRNRAEGHAAAGLHEAWYSSAVMEGHVEAIGAVATSRRDSSFVVTASQDRTAKIWELPELAEGDEETKKLRCLFTLKIHEKDINAIDVSPNDRILASGSQDRTARLFTITHSPAQGKAPAQAQLTPIGTLKGHKRGVWGVKFSSTEHIVATSSGDRTIKLWRLDDLSCIKTFEGHTNSVLRVDFISAGQQLMSSGSDGLVKLWNIKDESCVATLDKHEDRIWALRSTPDESQIVSGGADSVITFWEDVTEEEEVERLADLEERIGREQDFDNFVAAKDFTNAIILALSMDQPRRLLKLFTEVRAAAADDPTSLTGSTKVDKVIRTLRPDQLRALLGYLKDWNAVGRSAQVAQGVLNAVLRYHSPQAILDCLAASRAPVQELGDADADVPMEEDEDEDGESAKPKGKPDISGEILDALIPYSERHLNRADRMMRESYIVEHLLGMMGTFGEEELIE